MIEAGERDQLDELRLAPVRPQGVPERVAHASVIVQLVDQPEQQPLTLG